MLFYDSFGDGPQTPVVIVHGLFGSGRNWGVIARRLSNRGRVVTVDLRNHGKSEWASTHSYTDLASDLADLLSKLGGAWDVIGHSMGGKASMVLALRHSDLVRKLIIADIAPVSYSHDQLHVIDAMKKVDLRQISRRSDAMAQLAALGVDPELQSFLTQSLDRENKCWRLNLDTLAREMPNILSFPDISEVFDAPTLILSGADSTYVSPEHRPVIRALFPQAQFVKLKQAGHWLHAQQPRAFEAAVRGFLDTAPPVAMGLS